MKAISIILTLIWIIVLPSLSISGSVDYLYDDNGRLIRVSNDSTSTRLLYQYDEVGNLLSIYKEENVIPGTSAPVLSSIDPDIFLIGETYNVVITGQNLLTTESITSDNPDVTVKFIAAIDTKISAILSIADTASLGQANITVTTSYGSASMTINLYGATIIPGAVTLFPASSATMSVSLTPSAPKDVTVTITNNNPEIIDTSSSIIIPAGGSGNFTVKALKGGMGIINIGNAQATIYVLGGEADEKDALINSEPVSVSSVSGPVPDNSLIQSLPVTVGIDSVLSGTILSSNPVSIQWPTVSDAITVSLPVSVDICSDSPVRVIGTSTRYYNTLQAAYDDAGNGAVIQTQALTVFIENLNVNRNVSVIIEGGYNCDYTSNTGNTELKGTMTISGGTVTVKDFILKK